MKLFQYYESDGAVRVGILTSDGPAALPRGTKMEDLLDQCPEQVLECAKKEGVALQEAALRYAPVVSAPEKILCVGLNYDEHIHETGLEKDSKPGFPPVFCKFGNALIGHKAPLHLPSKAKQFDYEAELVIVMGKDCKCVTASEAEQYIAGYTIGNDFSARDMQFASSQWTMGKACDEFAPVGPYFVSKDEVDPSNLRVVCRVNGRVMQNSSTANMIYSCGQIVSYLSDFITLKKGDLIFTGTPSGVVLGKSGEDQVWLKAGDIVTVEIEGLGTLENTLTAGD